MCSVNSTAALNFSGGTLTVSAGSSQVSGNLTFGPNTSLTVQGSGASFTALASATVDAANLSATGGGVLTLPTTTYTGPSASFNSTLQASGSGSQLVLTGLTTLKGGQTNTVIFVNALSGGLVNLSAVSSYTGGSTRFDADGSSTINLSSLPKLFSDANNNSQLTTSNGGRIQTPTLTNINDVVLTVAGTSSVDTHQLTTATVSTLTVNAGQPDFSGLTTVDGDDLFANTGGVLALPNVTEYVGPPSAINTTLQANGAGSTLDLSHVTTFKGGQGGVITFVTSLNSGVVNLANLTSYTGGSTRIEAESSSTINLSQLPSLFSDANNTSQLTTTTGGRILTPALTTLNRVDLTIAGTGSVDTAQIGTDTIGSITVNSGQPNFSGLTTVDSDSLFANSGGVLALPNVTEYVGPAASFNTTLQVNGAAARSTCPHVTTFKGAKAA